MDSLLKARQLKLILIMIFESLFTFWNTKILPTLLAVLLFISLLFYISRQLSTKKFRNRVDCNLISAVKYTFSLFCYSVMKTKTWIIWSIFPRYGQKNLMRKPLQNNSFHHTIFYRINGNHEKYPTSFMVSETDSILNTK